MISAPAKCALTALSLLFSHITTTQAQSPTSASASAFASTTAGVMKLEGCFTSSGDFSNQGSYEWQSSKHCEGVCTALKKAAFGLQGGDCWCGNLMPPADSQVETAECTTTCNGWTGEYCGSDSAWTVWLTGEQAVVGYVGNSQSASDGTSSTLPSTSTPYTDAATTATTSGSSDLATSGIASSSTSVNSATSIPTPANSPSQTTTSSVHMVTSVALVTAAEPTTILATVTASGSVHTVTGTTITSLASTSSPNAIADSSRSGASKIGIAVGVAVGVVVVLALIGAAIFYIKRRKSETGEKRRHSRQSSLDVFRPGGAKVPNYRASAFNDSRLDPRIMSERRPSTGSIPDNVDYSRRILQVTNPDGK